MATLTGLQTEVTHARAKLATATETHYRAAQDGRDITAARKARDDAQRALGAAIAELAAAGEPAALFAELAADIPQLLLPVRVEARYVTTRHVMRVGTLDDVVDVSATSIASNVAELGFTRTSYELPHLASLADDVQQIAKESALRIQSGTWFAKRPDKDELWVRIFPDTVFTEAFERDLQRRELDAGRTFWTAIFAKEDPYGAWQRLVDATDLPRAAWIVRALWPKNFDATPSGTPQFPTVDVKDGAYTRAPVVRLLPERFVVRIVRGDIVHDVVGGVVPEPLPLGLDPLEADDDAVETSIVRDGTTLHVPANLKWLHDLDAAAQVGLAIRIDLAEHAAFREGVDSITVLGVKLSASPEEAHRMLGEHVENCLHKEAGLAILAQGTPTNASNDATKREVVDTEVRRWFDAVWSPDREADTDGNRLRRALGLAETVPLPGGDLRDIEDAGRVNAALWPATLGYTFLQFMAPKMDEATRDRVREFFVSHVSGRGLLPVLRIDRQPYGILPTTSLDAWKQGPGGPREMFLFQLWMYLRSLDRRWQELLPHVDAQITAASAGDRLDEAFLKMLGHNASSTHLDREPLANGDVRTALQRGYGPAATIFYEGGVDLNKRIIETATLRLGSTSYVGLLDCFGSPADRRRVDMPYGSDALAAYLEWLATAPFAKVWDGELGSINSVIARIARQAMMRVFLEHGTSLVETEPGPWLLRVRDFALERLHDAPIVVTPGALTTPLLAAYAPIIEHFGLTAPITLDPDRKRALAPVADKLATAKPVKAHQALLKHLAQLPAERLERLFGEHLDLCSHRLDAWLLGMVSERLERQRKTQPTKLGIGAYGCLFGITRATSPAIRYVVVTPERVPAAADAFATAVVPIAHVARAKSLGFDDKRMFVYLGEAPGSGAILDGATFRAAPGTNTRPGHGYLHAPSSDHAAAAAVIYAAHASSGPSDPTLAVDLESSRARLALEILAKLQEGASLGELLGMELERAIHALQLDQHLLDVRRAFPLAQRTENAGVLATTDGLAVLEASRGAQVPPMVAAIAPAVATIANMLDAVSDLLLAESVFQSTKGKPERASAALRTLHGGGQVVAPEIVRSPSTGRAVHHRVAILFPRGEASAGSPRTALAPDCNRWLGAQLPDLTKVMIAATLPDGKVVKVELGALDLEPLDLLAAAPETRAQVDSPLASLVAMHVRGDAAGPIAVELASRRGLDDDELAITDVLPQLDTARRLLGASRPLAVTDLGEPGATVVPRVATTQTAGVLAKLAAKTGVLAKLADELRDAATGGKRARLEAALGHAWRHGVDLALLGGSAQTVDDLVRRARAAADELERRRGAGEAALAAAPTGENMSRFEALARAATALLGPTARVFPEVDIAADGPFAAAYADRAKLTGTGAGVVERWLHEASLARDPLRAYRRLVLLRDVCDRAVTPAVVQLPSVGEPHPWLGGAFDAARDPGTVSFVLELPEGFKPTGSATGILVDEWPELVPDRDAKTGVTFQIEQPDSEPPQVLLFAVSPEETGNWQWEHLFGAVSEAIRLAKRRLVTPALIEKHDPMLAITLSGLMMPVAPGSTQIPTVELT